jgi:peptide/nickel transport system substrate-binding protein
VNYNIYDNAILQQKTRAGEFHANSQAGAYRFDPDSYVSRSLLSTAPTTKENSRFQNEKVDKLILEARQIKDVQKRLELYREIETIVNEELPVLYTHHLTLLEAGAMNLKNYTPAISGAPSTTGAGIRVAWMA